MKNPILPDINTDQTRKTQIQLEAIVEESHDAIIGKTLEGIITNWNGGATKMFGYVPDEVIGKSMANLFPVEKKDELPRLLEKVRKGEAVIDYDSIWIRKDGIPADVEFSVSPVHGKDGEIIGASVVGRDITNRKKAESESRKSKDFLDQVINTISDPVFVKDDQYRFVIVNDAEVALTGLKREVQIGKTTLESYPKSEADVFLKNDRDVLATGKENVNEEKLTDAKGTTLTIVTKKTLYKDTAGNKFVVGIIHDITERKNAEEKFKNKYDEMEKLYNSTINRELKMVELKNEIEMLKAKLENK